jgi:putative radical SAM enzyme (TIGR03279 family)
MSEAIQRKFNGLIVLAVEPNSPAAHAGLQAGDRLLRVNGFQLRDLIDFRYHTAEERMTLELEREGKTLTKRLKRRESEPIGLHFQFELADEIHTCDNKCVFCFIHQMPKGMRRSLYLMDDDYRLSFLHGNYVTLTNMSQEEFDRLIEQRLSPIYVSVHATEPAVRAVMLGRAGREPVLPRLQVLAEHGIEVHAQIVLCPGLNDANNFTRTLLDLERMHPEVSGFPGGVLSIAVVPVGLSKFRDKLYPLSPVNSEYAQEFLTEIEPWHRRFKKRLGTRFVFLSDEWFYSAGQPVPGKAYYEDFPQLEDGVGTSRLFLDETGRLARRLPETIDKSVRATLVTGELPQNLIRELAQRLNLVGGVELNVCVIPNDFFGGNINIAGLITGQDIAKNLKEFNPHPHVFIPSICLRDNHLFLDDWTVDQLAGETGLEIGVVKPHPKALWEAIRERGSEV